MLAVFLIDEPVLVYLVESPVFAELVKRGIQLCGEVAVAFLDCHRVFFYCERLGEYRQVGVFFDKVLRRRGVDDNCVYLTLTERLDRVGCLAVFVYRRVLNVLCHGAAGGTQLYADGLADEVLRA